MKNVRIEELSQSQRELLELIALNPTGYVTRTAEGSRDMMALAMKGLVADARKEAAARSAVWRNELADILDLIGSRNRNKPFTFNNLDELIFQLRKETPNV